MTTLVNEFRATYAFMERNANLVKRYWSWELVWLVYSIANSLSVSFIGLGMEQMGGVSEVDGRYLVLYLVVGTLVWRYLSLIFYWITDVIGMERWEGTIEYTLMAPIRRITHMAGQTLWAVIYSMISTAIILAVTVAIFHIDLSNANLMGGLVMLLAGSLSFIGVGVMGSVLPLLFPERGSQMTHVIIAVLPEFLQKLAVFSPATYVLDGTRQALLEGTSTLELWQYIWPTLLMGVVAIPVGLWVFGLAERYAKRTGKLHRNG
jgi:ABC-2 type transport system permease protein